MFCEICYCFDRDVRFSTDECAAQIYYKPRAVREAKKHLLARGLIGSTGKTKTDHTWPVDGWNLKIQGDWVPDVPSENLPDGMSCRNFARNRGVSCGKTGMTRRNTQNGKTPKSLKENNAAEQKAAPHAALSILRTSSANPQPDLKEPTDDEWKARYGC